MFLDEEGFVVGWWVETWIADHIVLYLVVGE